MLPATCRLWKYFVTDKLWYIYHSLFMVQCIVTSPTGVVAKYCDECVCPCVCLSTTMSLEPHARSLPNFLCMLPMSVARFSSGMLTIGRIAYRREGGDRSAQCGRSVIYDCLVYILQLSLHCFTRIFIVTTTATTILWPLWKSLFTRLKSSSKRKRKKLN